MFSYNYDNERAFNTFLKLLTNLEMEADDEAKKKELAQYFDELFYVLSTKIKPYSKSELKRFGIKPELCDEIGLMTNMWQMTLDQRASIKSFLYHIALRCNLWTISTIIRD